MQSFSDHLRHWRGQRHFSQLALATEADVSARHVSFLESGRSRPSREMVLQLAEALTVPKPERNKMLEAAGFAAHYRAADLTDADLAPVRRAMERMLDRHDPYPGILMDREWRILRLNRTAGVLLGMAGLSEGSDLLGAMLDPGRGAALIENWGAVGYHLAQRLRSDSRAQGGMHRLDQAAAQLLRDPLVAGYSPPDVALPYIPTVYRAGDLRLSLFSTIAQFTGAEDLTLSNLQIELMFPADDPAEQILTALAQQAGGA